MTLNEVVDFFFSTVDEANPEGNMKAVAEHFQITRAKVQKILITMEAIDSPLHQDIVKLKAQGYENVDIATMLGVSTATVSINLPYEKPMYGQEEKSQGAKDVENFRKREKIFLEGQKRKPSYIELLQQSNRNSLKDISPEAKKIVEDLTRAIREKGEDLVNLSPLFSEEETKLFQMTPDFVVLHIELMNVDDVEVLKKFGGVKYGETISRDVLVPVDMPLHNLHYLIQQVFGFLCYHLHSFQISEDRLLKLTSGKAQNWLKLMGVVFKNPLRNEDSDFWDDDYEGGSPKKYMRSKYSGPYCGGVYDETYQYCKKDEPLIKEKIKGISKVLDLRSAFYLDAFDLLERIPLFEILDICNEGIPNSFREYMSNEKECLEFVEGLDVDEPNSQPFVYPITDQLIYNYDYGDDWEFKITAVSNVQHLVDQGRLNLAEFRQDMKHLCECQRPVLIAADGYNLVEDVGGPMGYCAFLRGIHGEDCGAYSYEDPVESRAWARSLGWKEKVPNKSIV